MTSDANGTLTVDQQFIRDELRRELHQFRTDVTSALSEFATQNDLDTMVSKVADGAVAAAKDAIADLRRVQEQWQNEQRDKLDAFILEVRSKLDTFAPLGTVENLRTSIEDSHRHFTAITGAHGEAIDTLKRKVDNLEKQTNASLTSITASVANIDTRTNVMQNSILEFIESNKEYRATVSGRIDHLAGQQQTQKTDMEALDRRMDAEGSIIRDIDERTRTSMKAFDVTMYGDKEKQAPGLVAIVTELREKLSFQSLLFGTYPGRAILAGLYFGGIYLAGHPDAIPGVFRFLGFGT